jgi:hypothetical protein
METPMETRRTPITGMWLPALSVIHGTGWSLGHHHSPLGTCTAARPAELLAGLGAASWRKGQLGFPWGRK